MVTRKINNKNFSSFLSFRRKREAEKTAKSLRSRGAFVRIIPQTKKVLKTKFPFEVFTSQTKKIRRR